MLIVQSRLRSLHSPIQRLLGINLLGLTGNHTHKSPVTCRLSNRTKPNRSTYSGGLGQYLPTVCRHTYRQPALASLPLTATRGLPGKHRDDLYRSSEGRTIADV